MPGPLLKKYNYSEIDSKEDKKFFDEKANLIADKWLKHRKDLYQIIFSKKNEKKKILLN